VTPAEEANEFQPGFEILQRMRFASDRHPKLPGTARNERAARKEVGNHRDVIAPGQSFDVRVQERRRGFWCRDDKADSWTGRIVGSRGHVH